MFKREIQTIYTENINYQKMKWRFLAASENEAILELLKMIRSSDTGVKLITRAKSVAAEQGMTLTDVIIPSGGSLTDTTLIRKFNPSTPEHVAYESRTKVFLNRDLSVLDATLDLAHELAHFAFRSPFNPYVGHFDMKNFVTSTIEGRGGEVDAYLIECRVYDEVFRSRLGKKNNCELVKEKNKYSRKMAINEFYKVGSFHGEFSKVLKELEINEKEFSFVTPKQVVFISSAYSLPYPLAAVKEYYTIMGKACENDRKRMAYARQTLGRAPASKKRSPSSLRAVEKLEMSYLKRCSHISSK